ncbi:vacuolar transporter chaperone 1 [Paecilomyces variotii No. 5]|uniref:Vacuolar transporter chaperone 1 n=1 Tax=Byssochlamys spectabilis (strain No. 5 / NBRC 109023) TaxID=1356009 RepID=V5I1P6_BYSSN|nr:vacuolar transporter chaperone 1 [Paecilomyces variotii No. 5]
MSSQPLLQTAPGTFPIDSFISPISFVPIRKLTCHSSPPGKRIALPTRVEPKVFFANERTFLSWLNFTVILGGLAIGLLNFGDRVGRISAGLFTFIAMAAMIYALITFHWRAKSIRKRGQSGFDDRFGPSILAVSLLAAVVVNFILRIREGGKK